MADLESPAPSQPDSAGSREQGRTALRVRRGSPVAGPLILLVLAVVGIAAIIQLGVTEALWVVLAGILVVVVGLIVAVNPRRSSPPGGSESR